MTNKQRRRYEKLNKIRLEKHLQQSNTAQATKKPANKHRKNHKSNIDGLARKWGYHSYDDYLHSSAWIEFNELYVKAGYPVVCIACSYPKYVLHHVKYRKNLTDQQLYDVIPLCDRCHTLVHTICKSKKWPTNKTHIILQSVFKWTDEETNAKFILFLPHWEAESKRRGPYAIYKLRQDRHTVIGLINAGYTDAQIANLYGTSEVCAHDFRNEIS